MKKGIVIGAGIGGLTAAIALLKKGIDVEIYEQATELSEVGAGLWIAPNGMKIFQKLGIAKEIILAGRELDYISILDLKGKVISSIDGDKIQARHKFHTVAIHRAVLQKILLSYIPDVKIILNRKLTSFQQSTNSITANFHNGSTATADFLISADGIKSAARLQLHDGLKLRYSGQTCWRFVVQYKLPPSEQANMYEIWSNKKGLRVGYSAINDREVYVYITNYLPAGGKDNAEELRRVLLELCSDFPPVLSDLINASREVSIIRNDLYDFKPIEKWTEGRMALMGDAAHATTPNLGQGACQAIEDAYLLAAQLSEGENIEVELKKFQEKRIKKADFITKTSWQFSQITNTSGLIKSILVAILRMTPESINKKQLDKIYSVDWYEK